MQKQKIKAKKKNSQDLLLKNLKKTDLILEKLEKLEKDFRRAQLMNFIRFLLVAIPVFLAVLYLIPLFRQFLEIYTPVLDILKQFRTI